jgi:hypothetical protein
MGRKSNAIAVMQAEASAAFELTQEQVDSLTPRMREVIAEIDQIFGDVQVASLTAFWRVGKIITDVRNAPEEYLTEEQQSQHVDGASLIISIFSPIYSSEQLRGAVGFYEKYPSMAEVTRLLNMRCPDRPRWRLTVSHVQLLAQVTDDNQRQVLEEKCAEEAYTARSLALELQEIRGKRGVAGRAHRAPKGLKQQIQDLLQLQRRFIARSEKLWLSEEEDNLYDDIANTPPEKLDLNIRNLFAEVVENFARLSDLVADHWAMCTKIDEQVIQRLDDEEDDVEDAGTVAESAPQRRKTIQR